ncbi:hypothetical protein AAKU61_004536, partial [Undibacterium sp. GrIS 1.2]
YLTKFFERPVQGVLFGIRIQSLEELRCRRHFPANAFFGFSWVCV